MKRRGVRNKKESERGGKGDEDGEMNEILRKLFLYGKG